MAVERTAEAPVGALIVDGDGLARLDRPGGEQGAVWERYPTVRLAAVPGLGQHCVMHVAAERMFHRLGVAQRSPRDLVQLEHPLAGPEAPSRVEPLTGAFLPKHQGRTGCSGSRLGFWNAGERIARLPIADCRGHPLGAWRRKASPAEAEKAAAGGWSRLSRAVGMGGHR